MSFVFTFTDFNKKLFKIFFKVNYLSFLGTVCFKSDEKGTIPLGFLQDVALLLLDIILAIIYFSNVRRKDIDGTPFPTNYYFFINA